MTISMQHTYDAVQVLKSFVSPEQLSVLGSNVRGEEGQWFRGRLVQMAELVATMPKTYEQDGKGDNAIAYLHYFKNGFDWYITEKDMEPEQLQAFGLVSMYETELGYISIQELQDNNVELDLYFTPTPIGAIKQRLAETA